MTMPVRIQRRRTRGWRQPEGAVYVGRPTKWGNPWCICGRDSCDRFTAVTAEQAAEFFAQAVQLSDMAIARGVPSNRAVPSSAEIRSELAGKDLACWCPLDQPCHADVLLELANRERS